jgi:hypothetical protein
LPSATGQAGDDILVDFLAVNFNSGLNVPEADDLLFSAEANEVSSGEKAIARKTCPLAWMVTMGRAPVNISSVVATVASGVLTAIVSVISGAWVLGCHGLTMRRTYPITSIPRSAPIRVKINL